MQIRILFIVILIIISGCFWNKGAPTLTTVLEAPPLLPITIDATTIATQYSGGGSVTFSGGEIDFQPAAPADASETHAVLVLLNNTVTTPVRDFELIIDATTVQQLRTGANDWEVFWLVFGYQGTGEQKTANYFLEKPNSGIELGQMQGSLGQNFLYTSTDSLLTVNVRSQYHYTRQGNSFIVKKDGNIILNYNSTSAFPTRLYDGKGAIGFYTEDARVKIHSVEFRSLDAISSTTPSTAILPTLTNVLDYIAPEALSAGAASTVAVSNSASAITGPLFWSCNFSLVTSATVAALPSGDDCANLSSTTTATDTAQLLGLATFANGTLSWKPTSSQVGTYVFNIEGSQVGQGFQNKPVIVQVSPEIHQESLLLALDPMFSKTLTANGQQVLVERINGSARDDLSSWPGITGSASAILNLSETDPWIGTGSVAAPFALNFDGTQSGIDLSSNIFSTAPAIRVSFWVKPNNVFSTTTLFSQIDGSGNGLIVEQATNSSGRIDVTYTNTGITTCRSATALTSGEWVMVTAQVSSSGLALYINGNKECDVALNTALVAGIATPVIGAKNSGADPWSGELGDSYFFGKTNSAKPSTDAHIADDFLTTGNRYRVTPLEGMVRSDVVLHWDAANAKSGLGVHAGGASTGWWNLGPHRFATTFYNFNGNGASGWQSLGTPSAAYLKFDGTDDSIILDPNVNLSLSSEWTIEAWIMPGAALGTTVFKTVAETYDYNAGKGGFGLRLGGNNTVDAFVVDNTATDTVQGGTALAAASWYQVAATFNSTDNELKTYINGELSATQPVTLNPANGGDNPFFVGLPPDYDGTHRFNGNMAILRVYNKRLTRAQLRQNCWAQRSRFTGITCAN